MARKRILFNLQYPERNVTFKGNYNHSQATLTSDLALFWEKDEEQKTIGAGVDWRKISAKPMHQITALYMRHPSLERVKYHTKIAHKILAYFLGRYFDDRSIQRRQKIIRRQSRHGLC